MRWLKDILGERRLMVAVAGSFVLHTLWLWNITAMSDLSNIEKKNSATKVTFRVIETPKVAKKTTPEVKRLVETKLRPTEAPDEAAFLGAQNHRAERETRARVKPSVAGADARQGGGSQGEVRLGFIKAPTVTHDAMIRERRAAGKMDALVPTAGELVGQINQGFQDYIDKEVAEADRVDVNTTEYRYMGYMTQLRKAVELVWIYPVDALRRGWQGQGTCHFTIEKDGRVRQVKVASSTGYDALDRAFVEAVRMAAIPPLPASFDRARFPVNFDYRYVISGSAH